MLTAGVLNRLVEAALTARRQLWGLATAQPASEVGWFLSVPASALETWERSLEQALAGEFGTEGLRKAHLVVNDGATSRVHVTLLRTHELLRALLDSRPDLTRTADVRKLRADLAYFVWRALRRYHGGMSASDDGDKLVIESFRVVTGELKSLLGPTTSSVERADLLTLLPRLREAVHRMARAESDLELFLDVCFSLEETDRGLLRPGIAIRDEWLDAEFLLSRLLGFRTGIFGFDLLFEGGLRLADGPPGRVLLIRGTFGTAKSTLGLMLADEVARKGGVATIVALEDTVDALETYLRTYGASQGLPVSRTPGTAPALPAEGGALRILHSPAVKQSLFALSRRVLRNLPPHTDGRSPNLVVVDPINSLLNLPHDPTEARALTSRVIDDARERGANLLLVAEESGSPDRSVEGPRALLDELPFMVDGVLELSSQRVHGYEQRFIQVTKSRFQRERRGLHPIAIRPSHGLVVFPSSPAFISEVARDAYDARAINRPRESPEEADLVLGMADFGHLVGKLKQGDTLVFRGPQGGYKTLLALKFLAENRPSEAESHLERRSLFLTDRSNRPLKAYYDAHGLLAREGRTDLITLEPFQNRWVQPGRLLMEIQEHFCKARERREVFDRVVFANAGRWDLNCPFIRSDPGFGDALLALFEQEGASVVFVCAERETERESALQRLLVDRATVVVDFERVEYRGALRVLCRVTQTRSQPGSPNWHEVTSHGGVLRISPSLLRIEETPAGSPPKVYEVGTKLHVFLDETDSAQQEYVSGVAARIKSLVMTDVGVERIDSNILTQAVDLGVLSVASDLHIVQVDEYQLPNLKEGGMLHLAQRAAVSARDLGRGAPVRMDLDALPEVMREMISVKDDPRYVAAIPYYRNVGLLAVRRTVPPAGGQRLAKRTGRLPDSALGSWAALQAASRKVSPAAGELFFDLSARNEQNYVCLFLEMALDFGGGKLPRAEDGTDGLLEWISGGLNDDAFGKALHCFHELCHPGEKKRLKRAWVSRQWYATLHGLLRRDPNATYEVLPLPGRHSISGDWYLGVWARSAVPEVGFRIIMDELTPADAERRRFQRGIGLPVSPKFYESRDDTAFFPPNVIVSRGLRLSELVNTARRRSQIHLYSTLSSILATHLQFLLSDDDGSMELTRARVLKDVQDTSPIPSSAR